MCLKIKKGTKRKIAKKNIIVYKVLGNLNSHFFPWTHVSPYFSNMKWKRGIKATSNINRKHNNIEQALHSCSCRNNALSISKEFWDKVGVVKMYIPKGSIYYVGTFNGKKGYASNCLIFGSPKKK